MMENNEAMEEVIRNIRNIQKVTYTGSLYRADAVKIRKGTTADEALTYADAPIKYFTLHPEELGTYFKTKDYKFQTEWDAVDLVLVDLFHIPTRTFLYEHVFNDEERNAIDTAFPIDEKGHVYRQSDADTAHLDYTLLKALCRVDNIDGYHMNAQEPRNYGKNTIVSGFHSEVGLCNKAFSKLTAAKNGIQMVAEQAVKQVEHVERNRSGAMKLNFGMNMNGGRRRKTQRRQNRRTYRKKQRKTRKV